MLLHRFYRHLSGFSDVSYSLHHEANSSRLNRVLNNGALIDATLEVLKIPCNKDNHISVLCLENHSGVLAIATALHLLKHGCKDVGITLLSTHIDESFSYHAAFAEKVFYEHRASLSIKTNICDPILKHEEISQRFDIAIIDPPFGRYPDHNHPYPEIIERLYQGNAYLSSAYIAISLDKLKYKGQLLAITPRTYTAGDYSIGFRKYLFKNASIENINIVFEHINVNHQTIISRFLNCSQTPNITVGQYSLVQSKLLSQCSFKASQLIQGSKNDYAIYLPLSSPDLALIQEIESNPLTFEEAGYLVNTGPIIPSKHPADALASGKRSFCPKTGVVPLINLHNIKAPITQWHGSHAKDKSLNPLVQSVAINLIPNQAYVFFRRINSGFRTHNLNASVYFPHPEYKRISVENHINYISRKHGDLTSQEAQAIADFLNSEDCHSYLRFTSGSSQFNAKKIRKLRFPTSKGFK